MCKSLTSLLKGWDVWLKDGWPSHTHLHSCTHPITPWRSPLLTQPTLQAFWRAELRNLGFGTPLRCSKEWVCEESISRARSDRVSFLPPFNSSLEAISLTRSSPCFLLTRFPSQRAPLPRPSCPTSKVLASGGKKVTSFFHSASPVPFRSSFLALSFFLSVPLAFLPEAAAEESSHFLLLLYIWKRE